MPLNTSHWIKEFDGLLNEEAIKKRITVHVSPLNDLTSLPIEEACLKVDMALKRVFYPTTQCLNILKRLIGMGRAHAKMHYPDTKTFLSGVYAQTPSLPDFMTPICLTGLAGIGKTEVLRALRRLLPGINEIILNGQPAFPIKGIWNVTVKARTMPKDILRALVNVNGSPADLVEVCRKHAYRDGVSILVADEFQFATGSENANARVSQMLLSLGYIGIPFIYAANYSLLRRLKRRPEEDQQRLLADPVIMLPDKHDSVDWQDTLNAQCEVAPGYFVFDPIGDAKELHGYTAGRKRAMARLLGIAFRREFPSGGVVDAGAIRRAYFSSEFSVYREETEILVSQAVKNRPDESRNDLWCPIPMEPTAATAFLEAGIAARNEAYAEMEIRSALTQQERLAANEIKKGAQKARKAGELVHFRKKSQALSADDLKKNTSTFLDGF